MGPTVRAAAHARARSAITARTRVVVAHSLGSVVAYEVLADLPAPASLDLVTLGSPLGHRPVVGEGLRPALQDGLGRWPTIVRHWTNITAVGDPVADGHPVDRVFFGVEERRIDNGHRPHDPEPYLCARATGEAIARGLVV